MAKKAATKVAKKRSTNLTAPTSISIPHDLRKWWTAEADMQRRSLSNVVVHLLELERRRVIAYRESMPVNGAGLPMTMTEQWLANASPEVAAPAAKRSPKR